MNFDILISQYDNHNEAMILLCKKFNISKVVLVQDKSDVIKIEELNNIYKSINSELMIESINLELGNSCEIEELLEKFKEQQIIVCLNGGNRINSLFLLEKCLKFNIQSVYIDISKQKRYVFGENSRVIQQTLEDMSIGDVTKLSGVNIIEDSSNLCCKKEILDMSYIILNNIELWHKYKQTLYNNNIFDHDYKDTSKVKINMQLLDKEQNILVQKSLKYLKDVKGIDYSVNNDSIDIVFKNNYLKGFIFKSGTWLEVLTSKVIKEINEIDEVKSSVLFFWSENARRVKNELDVVAVKDSRLICISCKDSDKYDDNALNELEVYSKKLGGNEAIKILVATKLPIKKSVIDRAREMQINLIILDKDINKFKGTIKSIIKK